MCSERETSGLICQSCNLLARCIKMDGHWQTIPVETCNTDEGFYCNVNSKGCSNETGPCHPLGFEGNFACTSEGVFPDPYDCQKYHMCYRAGHTIVAANIECGGDRAFSAATGDCSLTLNDDVCHSRQYLCNDSGDSMAWSSNRNIFFICKATSEHGQRTLFPALYRCASGEVFDGHDCIPKLMVVYHSSPRPINHDHEFICEQRGLYEDPLDCHSYYYCDSALNWIKLMCPSRTHFNNRTKSCVRGEC